MYNGKSYRLSPPYTPRTDLPLPLPSAASEPWHGVSRRCHGYSSPVSLCSQHHASRRDAVLVCPSSESPCAQTFPIFSLLVKLLSSHLQLSSSARSSRPALHPTLSCPCRTCWQYLHCCHCRCVSLPGSASAWALGLGVQDLKLRGRSRHSHVRTLHKNQQAGHKKKDHLGKKNKIKKKKRQLAGLVANPSA